MEINVLDEKVRVNISADLTAEELRDLLGALGDAHGKLTGVVAPDTMTARFQGTGLDLRTFGNLVQVSVKGPTGWHQQLVTPAQFALLVADLGSGLGGIPSNIAAN